MNAARRLPNLGRALCRDLFYVCLPELVEGSLIPQRGFNADPGYSGGKRRSQQFAKRVAARIVGCPMPKLNLTQPLVFEPVFMERVWGGRRLESLYGKRLPSAVRIGESWEIVDRPEAQSVVNDGPLRGQTLHMLWKKHREEIFGDAPDGPSRTGDSRFPILA